MAILNAWQKISRVLPGLPFGNGTDGSLSSATIPTITVQSCSGSSNSTTLTISSAAFTNGDIILIHQSRGTGVGQWEINRVVSGGGTTTLTVDKNLQYTYTDSGASQAQVIKIFQYTNVTVQSGTWTVPVWNKNTGGILVFAASGTVTVNGTISGVGGSSIQQGGTNTSSGGTGSGFCGGASIYNANAQCGEGTTGDVAIQNTANGNGGGGTTTQTGGAGGSNGTQGGTGTGTGVAGAVAGTDDLTNIVFGGGGGGGRANNASSFERSGGGSGSGIVIIFGQTITINGAITMTGGASADVWCEGGAGAGGSVLLVTKTATLGSGKVTAVGGIAGGGVYGAANGGNGGNGRIAIHYKTSVSGTTSPTYTGINDTSLTEGGNTGAFFNFF